MGWEKKIVLMLPFGSFGDVILGLVLHDDPSFVREEEAVDHGHCLRQCLHRFCGVDPGA